MSIAAHLTSLISLEIARRKMSAELDEDCRAIAVAREQLHTEENMEIFRKAVVLACLSLLSLGGISAADQTTDVEAAEMEQLREKAETSLKQTFSNFKFYSFEPTTIPGLYQIDVGSNMIYYHPESGQLIFGQIYDENGQNLTEIALSKASAERMKSFDYSAALELGPEDAPVLVEFSNPFCGHCQNLHRWLETGTVKDVPVRRRIIFAVGHSRQAQDAAEHILCSDDKEAAFAEIYERRSPRRLRRCEEGYELVQKHIELAEAAGVTGTPTLFAEGKRIRGFDQPKIEEFLMQQPKGE